MTSVPPEVATTEQADEHVLFLPVCHHHSNTISDVISGWLEVTSQFVKYQPQTSDVISGRPENDISEETDENGGADENGGPMGLPGPPDMYWSSGCMLCRESGEEEGGRRSPCM